MSAPKVHIGRTYGHQGLRTARSLTQAFGPYARLTVETPAEKWDRRIGRFCTAIVVAAMVALFVNAAFGGI